MQTEASDATRAVLAAADLQPLLTVVDAWLAAHRGELDDINVFPVPDGDTGSNMAATVRAALDAAVTGGRGAAAAAVRGARGNSGVILSQVLQAVIEALDSDVGIDAAAYAAALERGRDLAYRAVATPVPGTILSALDAAAEAARAAAVEDADLTACSARVRAAVVAAVARTPQQLDVLAHYGVVDAGARGLQVVLEAVHGYLIGQADAPEGASAAVVLPPCPSEAGGPRYEVQYVLRPAAAQQGDTEGLQRDLVRELDRLGDSVTIAHSPGLLAIHVHTDNVGPALEAGLGHGQLSQIEVADLHASVTARTEAAPPPGARLRCVAVLPGATLAALASRHGAVVLPGGSGALPPAADVVAAARSNGQARVAVLPGHPAVTAALAAVNDDDTHLDVVDEADSPPAVLAALAMLDPDADAARVVADMRAAAASVCAAEVTVADGDALAALADAAAACGIADGEVVTLIVGDNVDAGELDRAKELMRTAAPGADVEVILADIAPTRYCIGVEA